MFLIRHWRFAKHAFANFADMFAFILWQCGDKNYQIK